MKYVPANEAGEKPYVVTLRDWGRTIVKVVYANSNSEARYSALGRPRPEAYVVECRRQRADEL